MDEICKKYRNDKNAFYDIMNSLMMKSMNTKTWNSVIAGHKKYIETGEIVTQKTDLELDKIDAIRAKLNFIKTDWLIHRNLQFSKRMETFILLLKVLKRL